MSEGPQTLEIESIPLPEIASQLRASRIFAQTNLDNLRGVDRVDRIRARAGTVLVEPGEANLSYWLVLEGEIRAERPEPDGTSTTVGFAHPGDGFGEAPLLTGKNSSPFLIRTVVDTLLIRFTEEGFWNLLACCRLCARPSAPTWRSVCRSIRSKRCTAKNSSPWATLAAGLMHELHNPGSAAKRAASQLRENLLRLQRLSLRFSDEPKNRQQLDCMKQLLEHALSGCHAPALSTLEQSDAEEALADWLAAAGVEKRIHHRPRPGRHRLSAK